MADEPKAPRKRAAKKAVDGESKKVSKKAAAIPVPLFQAAPVSKTGNGSFDFPVGDGATYRSFNASNLKGSTVEARYVANNPLDVNNTLDYNVEEISQTEYWVLKSSSDEAVNVNLKNGDGIAYIKNGVWVKDNNSLKGSKDGSIFTSGKSKDFVKEIGVGVRRGSREA